MLQNKTVIVVYPAMLINIPFPGMFIMADINDIGRFQTPQFLLNQFDCLTFTR